MTGFGVGRGGAGGEEFTAEVKAVNHKYVEVKVRLPRELQALEPGRNPLLGLQRRSSLSCSGK